MRRHCVLAEGKGLSGRHRQLQAHEVEPGHQLGHAVLHLEARVHLQEVEATVVDQVLHGAGSDVADRPGDRHGGVPHLLGGSPRDDDRRRLLHHLLVPALHRALPVEQVQDGPVGVPDHLDLDVAGGVEVALQEDLVGAEGGRRLALRRRHGIGQFAGRAHEPHAAAAATGGRLDEKRVADVRRGGPERRVALPCRHHGAGQHGDAGSGGQFLGPRLVSHHADRLGRRPDPDDARRRARLGQGRVLGEEPVAGMQGVRPGRRRRRHQRGGGEIRLAQRGAGEQHRRVGLADMRAARVVCRVDGDGLPTGIVRAADEPAGDFAPVGHEQPAKRLGPISAAPRRRRPSPGRRPSAPRSARWRARSGCRADR